MNSKASTTIRRNLLKRVAAGQITLGEFVEASGKQSRPESRVKIYTHLNGHYARTGEPISQEQYEAEVGEARAKGTLINLSLNLNR